MPILAVRLIRSGNLADYPDDFANGYTNGSGELALGVAGWDIIYPIPVQENTWYSFYENTNGISYKIIAAYSSDVINAANCIDPSIAPIGITKGFKFQTPAGTTHVAITFDNNTTAADPSLFVMVEGEENIGERLTLYRLNSDVENGWYVRAEDIFGLIQGTQLADGIIDSSKLSDLVNSSLLTNSDKYLLRTTYQPLNPDITDQRSVITPQYGVEENVPFSNGNADSSKTFAMYSNNTGILTLKRVFDSILAGIYSIPNILRLYGTGLTGVSLYSPTLNIRISKANLASIGIDVDAVGYTTKTANIRIAIANLIGFVGEQVFVTLCYRFSPFSKNTYSLDDANYTMGVGTRVPGNPNIATDNPTLTFNGEGRVIIENGSTFRFLDDLPINKTINLGGTDYDFQGLLITVLGNGADITAEDIRGFDVHSFALVNNDDYDVITTTTDLKNRPSEVNLKSISINDVQGIDVTGITQNQTLLYNSITGNLEPGETTSKRTLTIQNSDKIAFYGCSYTESYYTVKNKSWVNKIGQMTDWIVANFGQSGNRITDIVERIRDNSNPYHSTVGVRELAPTVVSIANIGNETLHNWPNLDYYRQEFLLAFQHVRELGAEMIVGTDHLTTVEVEAQIYALAKELGVEAHLIGVVGSKVYSSTYGGFIGGGHPGTRTNAHTFLEWMYFINTLKRPERSIKVFRVRSEYQAGSPTVAQLAYDTNLQRLRYFQEINSGEASLSEVDGVDGWEYYDRLDELHYGVNVPNEYCNLINEDNVAFTGFALVEFIIDRIRPDSLILKVKIDGVPDNVYLANNNSPDTQYDSDRDGNAFEVTKTVYDAFSESVGEAFTSDATGADLLVYEGKVKNGVLGGYWLFFTSNNAAVTTAVAGNLIKTADASTTAYIQTDSRLGRHRYDFISKIEEPWSRFAEITTGMTYAGGLLTIVLASDFHKYIQYDKIRLLLAKSGSFNIKGVEAEHYGGIEKKPIVTPKYKPKQFFTELNTYQGFDTDWTTTGAWVNDGASLEQMPVAQRNYPPIHSVNRHIELGFDVTDGFPQSISKDFTIDAHRGNIKIVVRVIARLFPKIFDTTEVPDDYHTATRQIKADSYDMGTLVLAIHGAFTTYAVVKRPVDIGWSEVIFETYIAWDPSSRNYTLKLYRDEQDLVDTVNYRNHLYPMQIYDVSVQVEKQ